MLVLSHIGFVRRGWRLAGETFGVMFTSLSLRLTRLKDAELEVTAVCVSIWDNASTSERGEQACLSLLQLLRGAVLDWLVSVVQSTEIEHAKASVEN